MTDAYRPSNGDEGIAFMAEWCDRCTHDAAFQAGTGDGCPIVARTMALQVDDPRYPAEWVAGDDGPRCTAFEAVDAADERQAVMQPADATANRSIETLGKTE